MVQRGDRPPLQREVIVVAARELIREGGLEALSLRRLAERLGVTAPALYAHVRDKTDLLRAVAEGEFAALVAAYTQVEDREPLDRMRAHARAYIRVARDEPEMFRVMVLFPPELGPADVPDDAELPAATAAFALAAGAVEEAAAGGAIATDDVLLTTLTFFAAAHGVATVLGLGFGLPPELEDQMIDEMLNRLIAGYRTPEVSSGRL